MSVDVVRVEGAKQRLIDGFLAGREQLARQMSGAGMGSKMVASAATPAIGMLAGLVAETVEDDRQAATFAVVAAVFADEVRRYVLGVSAELPDMVALIKGLTGGEEESTT